VNRTLLIDLALPEPKNFDIQISDDDLAIDGTQIAAQ